jgi:hypothetical protein
MFNESLILGGMIINYTNSVTGNMYLTLFSMMFMVFLFFIAMRIPVELTAILLIPIVMVFMSYYGGEWKGFAGILLIYVAILFGRFFMR